MKPSLADIQNDFLSAFYQAQSPVKFIQYIQTNNRMSTDQQFDIYKGSIVGGLTKCLRSIYDVCEKLTGEEFFHGLAYSYIEKHPSSSPDLANYGDRFADFVESFQPAQCLPYLPDICRLCWAWHQAYLKTADASFDIHRFSQLSDLVKETVIFALPTSAQLLSSPYPIDRIWQMCEDDNPKEIILTEERAQLLIWRIENIIKIDKLNDNEWLFANALASGFSIASLHERVVNLDISNLLSIFLSNGWLRFGS